MIELPANVQAIISFVLALIGAYSVLLLAALVVWTAQDIRSRSRDILVHILAVILVLLFNLPGLLLYLVMRPRQTLSEAYESALGQEALLQDIEERYVCPVCKRKAEADYLVCPHCENQLRLQCEHCGRLLNLNWPTCPYCGHKRQEPPVESQA
jgi:hypothetical protein